MELSSITTIGIIALAIASIVFVLKPRKNEDDEYPAENDPDQARLNTSEFQATSRIALEHSLDRLKDIHKDVQEIKPVAVLTPQIQPVEPKDYDVTTMGTITTTADAVEEKKKPAKKKKKTEPKTTAKTTAKKKKK